MVMADAKDNAATASAPEDDGSSQTTKFVDDGKHRFVGAEHLRDSVVATAGYHGGCYACGGLDDDPDHDGQVDDPMPEPAAGVNADDDKGAPMSASVLTSPKAHLSSQSAQRGISVAARERAAKKGEAMPDGSYPIRDGKDLENAIRAIGRAKDAAAVKRHIIRRARALGQTAKLPDSWKETASREFYSEKTLTASVAATATETGISEAKLQAVWNRGLLASGSERLAAERVQAFVRMATFGQSEDSYAEDADLLPRG